MNKEDTLETLRRMRRELTAAQAQLTDVMEAVAANFPNDQPVTKCPECGIAYKRRSLLEEHRYRQHDGPVPEHYLAAERAAGYEVITTDVTKNPQPLAPSATQAWFDEQSLKPADLGVVESASEPSLVPEGDT